MSNEVATVSNAFTRELNDYTPNLAQALPSHVSVEKFKRVLITAVGMNPDLYHANRRTFYTAAVRCASDGLLPDGREAALVTYRTKMKRRDERGVDREEWIDAVTYMPMVAGIRKRMRNSGEVLTAIAEVVYTSDHFKYRLGDDPFIEHEPPALSQDRGEPIGAYAIIRLRSGEVLRDVMPLKEIEAARQQGRATNSLMWTKFWSEGAKKTVLRRCAKAAPQSAELDALLMREEEPPLLPDHREDNPLPPLPAPPLREAYQEVIEEAQEREFDVIDSEGAVHTFQRQETALSALCQILREAAQLGPDRLAGVWEDNQPTLSEMERLGFDITAGVELYASLARPPAAARRLAPGELPAKGTVEPARGPDLATPTQGEVHLEHPVTGEAPVVSRETGRVERLVPRQRETGGAPAEHESSTEGEPQEDVFGLPPRTVQAPPPRENQALEMVMSRGEPNYPTWVRARLIPRMRRQRESNDLAWFVADNDENIELAKRHPELAREIEDCLAEQWRVIGELEKGNG